MPNELPGILPVFPVFPAFLRFWKKSAITTHTNSRAGGKDYASFNKLPQMIGCFCAFVKLIFCCCCIDMAAVIMCIDYRSMFGDF